MGGIVWNGRERSGMAGNYEEYWGMQVNGGEWLEMVGNDEK